MNVKYKKFTPEELDLLVRRELKAEEERAAGAYGGSVYKQLFAGLDFPLLSLMCVQVQWSLKDCGTDPFMKAMRLYADKIVALVPIWKKLSVEIMEQGAFIASKIKEAMSFPDLKNTGRVHEIYAEMKNRLKAFEGIRGDMAEAADRQSDLANFIIGELKPAVADKERWTEFGLETCLSNDLFIKGTEVSLYNAKTLFSFAFFNVSRCSEIMITESAESPSSILFRLSGQAGVWECTAGIAKRLLHDINSFMYTPPPVNQ